MSERAKADDGTSRSLDLSIVVPAFDEHESIAPLHAVLVEAVQPLGLRWELVLVDDGSTDGTFEQMTRLEPADPATMSIRCIQLRKNFGKSIALTTGFARARGDVVITMDADLQDDPAEIPRLLEAIEDGWDVVSGWKSTRRDPLEKRVMSRLFNAVVTRVSGLRLHDLNCGLKAYRREVVEKLRIYGEHHRFIPVIAASYGYRVTELPVRHHARVHGRSKYGVTRYLSGLFDFFTVTFLMFYGRRPLHFLGTFSIPPFLAGWALVLYVMVMKYGFDQTGSRPALIAGVFFIGTSLQIFLFGLLAELMTHVSFRTSFEPEDFVRQTTSPERDVPRG